VREREYGLWTFNPRLDPEPSIRPVGRSRHWAYRRAEAARDEFTEAKVVFKYDFMPDMPWTDD
jgi:hypothetical protein